MAGREISYCAIVLSEKKPQLREKKRYKTQHYMIAKKLGRRKGERYYTKES
jgi:hypothetical protein